jgi:hypothetical protein
MEIQKMFNTQSKSEQKINIQGIILADFKLYFREIATKKDTKTIRTE